jgi:hypothetical protein
MATKAKSYFDYKDQSTSTAIITVATAIGIFYGIAKRKSVLATAGFALAFGLGGVVISVVTSNLQNSGNNTNQ